ncbi:MAG: Tim44-like domain-containing protein, partial [Planctomycetaceae bacterium]
MRRESKLPRILALITLVGVLLLQGICLEPSWGRAGGGGGYSGGGGGFGGGGSFGGGGFSGGGSGGGSGRPMTGAEAVVVVIVVIGIIIYQIVQQSGQSTHSREDSTPAPPGKAEHERMIQQLQARDPQFDFEHFAERVENAFLQIQDAWQNQDLTAVHPFISDSILERFSIQIDEQKRAGYRDQMSDIDVHRHSMRLASLTSTPHFDTLDIRITVAAVDYRVSLETGRPIDGKSGSESFTEYWSFLRRGDVTTRRDQKGLIEGNCPNCGAALELNQIGGCSSCQAVLRSGAHDWVLAEITQACEWRPASHQNTALAAFRDSQDPGFSIQHIEDRASVIFWRKSLADRTGEIAPLRKMATDDFCQSYAAELSEGQTDSGRKFWHDCAVGSVACLGLV